MDYQQRTRYFFVVNNPSDKDESFIRSFAGTATKYLIYGKKKTSSDVSKIQGFMMLSKRMSLVALSKLDFPGKVQLIRYKPSRVIDYIKHLVGPFESGSFVNYKKHHEIAEFKKSIKSGVFDLKRLREDHSTVCAKFPRFVEDYIRDNLDPLPLNEGPLSIHG